MDNICDDYKVSTHGDMENCFQSLLVQTAAIEGHDHIASTSFDCGTSINIIPSSSQQLLQDLSFNCIHNVDSERISQIYDDNFFESHAIECGYRFTEDFLSIINKKKSDFIGEVDSILDGLSSAFYFLKELDQDAVSILELMNKICYSFSKKAHDLKSECINVLQSKIIPVVIKDIFDSKVIGDGSVREMTYTEMERLFLHFVATLERLIVSREMKCWDDFCSENESLLLSISDVDYSCPFCLSNYDVAADSGVSYPAAFVHKFGEYISFMAATRIDDKTSDFVIKCSRILKDECNFRCDSIRKYSPNVYADIREFRNSLDDLIKDVFNNEISQCKVRDEFSGFLNELVIWNKQGVGTDVILEPIIGDMYNSLKDFVRKDLCGIVSSYYREVVGAGKYAFGNIADFGSIEHKWGFKLHPRDNGSIYSIRRKFSSAAKRTIINKLRKMLREKYRFPDGTIISVIGWVDIVRRLYPIIRETVDHLICEERVAISKILSNIRIVENVDVFDGHCSGTRAATSWEKDIVFSISVKNIEIQVRELSRKLWTNLISGYESNESEWNTDSNGKEIDSSLMPEDGDSLVVASLVRGKSPEVELGINYKVIGKWGLNIHPDDERLILLVRRRFSSVIKSNFCKLFSDMLEAETILPSGRTLRTCSWALVSSELSGIAIKSVESIIEDQCAELEMLLTKFRVVDVDKNDSLSFIVREITDNEKNKIMIRAKSFIDRSLIDSAKSSWLFVVNSSSSKIDFEGMSENIDGRYTGVSFGLRLRYCDSFAIFSSKKKFFSEVRFVVSNKFSKMLKDGYVFCDNTTIGRFSWSRLSRKLEPIANAEIKHLFENESKELEEIISRSRAVVGHVTYSIFDRELTVKEVCRISKSIIGCVNKDLKRLFGVIWRDLISYNVNQGSTVGSADGCVGKSSSSLINGLSVEGVYVEKKDCSFKVSLYHEDDLAILNARKKFLHEIKNLVRNKFIKMIDGKYRSEDGTVIGKFPWGKISKILIPIAKEEIGPVLEKERAEINDILLKSRAISISEDGSTIARKITTWERASLLVDIMKRVHRVSVAVFKKSWRSISAK